jgi:hypothetical protein
MMTVTDDRPERTAAEKLEAAQEARERRERLSAQFERDNAGVPWYRRVPGGPPKAKPAEAKAA